MTQVRGRDVALLAAGAALGGWFGLAVAALAVVAVRRSPSLAPWLPVVLLGVAALATVIPEVPADGSLRSTFADDRQVAASAALAAGIVLLVLLVEAAASAPASPGPVTTATAPSPWVTRAATSRTVQVVAGAATAAALLRLLVGGPVLSPAEVAAAAGLRAGDGFPPEVPPLAVGLDALSPVGATTLGAVAAAGLVLALSWLTSRLTDARTGAVAAVVAVAVPLTWASPLAATTGLLAVAAALAVLSRNDLGVPAALGGGALLGLATLARPELGLVAVAALAWCGVRPRPLPPARFVATVVAAVATTIPWLVHVDHRTGTPGLAASTGDVLRAVGELDGGLVVEIWAAVGMVAATATLAVRHRWFLRRLAWLLPLATGAVVALVLLALEPDVVALYPALPLATLVLAATARTEVDRRTARR